MSRFSYLREFGFDDPESLPRRIRQEVVTLSLPQAMERGLKPAEVTVEDGLLIPLSSLRLNGLIIRRDGAMLHVGHMDASDTSTPLETSFIFGIPYELRLEVWQIMKRALMAAPDLQDIWGSIHAAWAERFPARESPDSVQLAGEYLQISQVREALEALVGRLIAHARQKGGDVAFFRRKLRIVVQTAEAYERGWQGEELIVDDRTVSVVLRMGSSARYVSEVLFPALDRGLRDPLFVAGASYRLYYITRSYPVVKLVVVPPAAP